jgi:hypothetical protein
MGTFAETASVDYRFLFADQGKQTPFSVSISSNGSLLFLFSVWSKQMEVTFFC